ncbi:MAG: asparagine synthetase B, partial [Candidatus Kerfeldbacteria bacterium]|nr:asparagine synthetase B [Candidatus Kerfeldbacteria bacterium]
TELIRRELSTSVRLRMISDVPLGAFLSGGIDSSAVVAMMAKHSDRPVKTFSIGFKEASHNELPYAKMIAQQYATEHTEFVVEPQAVDILPKLAWQYEEPFADSSALPTYILSQLTRQHVTVALNGDGGDENFAGYERYPIYSFASILGRMPRVLKHLARGAATSVRALYPTTLTDRAARFASSLLTPPARRYLEYMQYFSDEYKQAHYTTAFRQRLGQVEPSWQLIADAMQRTNATNPMVQVMGADNQTYLPDDLLVKVDIASMAWSLEGRSPLLDHVFMEMTATIPPALKVKGQQKKYIFRQALRGIVPDSILDRPKKGFGVPIEHWFRGELNGFIGEHLERFAKRDIFAPDVVRNLLRRHTSGRISYAYQLWSLLMLELWYEQYID